VIRVIVRVTTHASFTHFFKCFGYFKRSRICHNTLEGTDNKTMLSSTSRMNRAFFFLAVVTGKFPWSKWPKGTYGLPMAKTGCPKQYGLRWEEGWYVQDTEDTDNKNDISNENHLMGSMNTSKLPPPCSF